MGRIAQGLQSPDEATRAKAVGALCPCRIGMDQFEQHLGIVARFVKDPSPAVRATALHVFEDAGEAQNEGYPTHPREATDEMRRRRRHSRFRPDDTDAARGRKPKWGSRRPS